MRIFYLCLVLVLPCSLRGQVKETKSALETDPQGWVDLLQDPGLKKWKRVSIPPKSPLKEKNPWTYDGRGKTLHCDGVGVHEMFLYQEEFGDGIFHIEWRFQAEEGKKGFNSGVYVRNSADGTLWHQAQVGSLNVGQIFGNTLVNGEQKRINVKLKDVPQRGRPAGEWNTYEITCKGKEITLWINGAVTSIWDSCEVPQGFVGVEAEGYVIEFRNVLFKKKVP